MMNISISSGPLALTVIEAVAVNWTVSYSPISDATSGVGIDVTTSGTTTGPSLTTLVSPVADIVRQVKNINVIANDACTIKFSIG